MKFYFYSMTGLFVLLLFLLDGSIVLFGNEIVEAQPKYCNRTDVSNFVGCILGYTKTFYNYTEIYYDKDLILNETQLRETGGDCSEWGNYYKVEAEKRGLNAQIVDFYNGTNIGHRVVIVYNENMSEYCFIDNLRYSCNGLG